MHVLGSGAPGSQNGFINSGHYRDAAYWHTNSTNVARTNELMKSLTAMFEHKTDVVSVIQIINEYVYSSPLAGEAGCLIYFFPRHLELQDSERLF